MNSNKKSTSLSGPSALTKLFRQSKDQVMRSVKKRYTGKAAPKNIAKDMRTILSLLNVENKQVYTLATGQTVTQSAPLVYGLSTTSQGSGSANRTGDSIKVDRIDLILQFEYSTGTLATTSRQTQIFNWYLVRYLKTPSSGGTASFAITEFINVDGGGSSSAISFPNSDTNQNFDILKAGQVVIDLPYTAATSATTTRIVTHSQECSFHQTYNGSGTSNITDNMVYLVFTAASNANAGGTSLVTVQSCMWFIDN